MTIFLKLVLQCQHKQLNPDKPDQADKVIQEEAPLG